MEATGKYLYDSQEPLFIPVSSDIDNLVGLTGEPKMLMLALHSDVSELTIRIIDVLRTLRARIAITSDVSKFLSALGAASVEPQPLCLTALGELALTLDGNVSKQTLLATSGDQVEAFEEYANYDSYFGFRRASDLDQYQFMAQVVRTTHRTLTELSTATIGIDEICAILDAITAMLSWFGAARDRRMTNAEKQLSAGQPGRRPEALTLSDVEYADYRWILGHHLFNLCAVFCRNALQRGAAAIDDCDPDRASAATNDAAVFLRGTTAAMWLAGNFPADIYRQHTRPSMARHSGRISGFSGTQNLDYLRLRQAADSLTKAIQRQMAPKVWTTELSEAILRWFETEAEDVEHHVLIAASKVGVTSSLLQESVAAYLPSSISTPPAVDMLRELLITRRKVATTCLVHIGVLQ